ncbi:hypothetical protein OTU49_011421, partial [Cherax quadricarinatus]
GQSVEVWRDPGRHQPSLPSSTMDAKILCLCVLMCVVLSTAIPVLQLMPATLEDQELEPAHHVLIVKRSARIRGHQPCPIFSAYRCPHQDLPALCRGFDVSGCHDTEFIDVNI